MSQVTSSIVDGAASGDNSTALVLCQRVGAVGILTLNQAPKRNVLSSAMLNELLEQFKEAAADLSLKCLIIAANGPAFCAGHDLKEILAGQTAEHARLFELCTRVMEAIRLAPQPVIAQVQGVATAAGCQLAATCDLVIAAEDATFATPGVKIGLFCSTPAVALSRAVPTKKALEMLFTGTPITAAEAERLGLVNRVVPQSRLAEETLALAQRIATASGDTLARGKQSFYEQVALDRPRAYQMAQAAMVENAQSVDAREGMQAFVEKRPPRWQN
jgi:enoyl-CoA hydratase/carnithine racemase